MSKITKSFDPDIDLTIFTVVGEATFDELWDQTRVLFKGKLSKLVLWDFTAATAAGVSSQELKEIARRGGTILSRVAGGKGAILAPKDIDYGIGRIFQVFSEQEIFPLEVEIFRDKSAAINWLISAQ